MIKEESIENLRVDYALRNDDEYKVFIEAKRPSEDISNHEKQLLQYSFSKGVGLGLLTNGITWWFYLPIEKGEWSSRRFYEIDLFKQEVEEIVAKFINLLSKDNIYSNNAQNYALKLFQKKYEKGKIEKSFVAVWNRLITEPNSLLVDITCTGN